MNRLCVWRRLGPPCKFSKELILYFWLTGTGTGIASCADTVEFHNKFYGKVAEHTVCHFMCGCDKNK